MRCLVALLMGLVAISAYPRESHRIIGGSVTTINQYPDIASLLFALDPAYPTHDCGGIIINNRSILTAAHCTYRLPAPRRLIRLGSTYAHSGGIIFNTAQIITHPSYDDITLDNDISIIRVTSEIRFSDVIRQGSFGSYVVGDNEVVWAAGWGWISASGPTSEQLRHVQIWTINQAVCRQRYGYYGDNIITDNMLCAGWLDVGGRDQCAGDSGGPLYHHGVVVGVTSFGKSCASPHYPGVNARISRYYGWINQNR